VLGIDPIHHGTPKGDAASKARTKEKSFPGTAKETKTSQKTITMSMSRQITKDQSATTNTFTVQVKPSNTEEEVRARLKNAAQSRGLI
jgi:hypothetical protein